MYCKKDIIRKGKIGGLYMPISEYFRFSHTTTQGESIKVSVTLDENGEYWGWLSKHGTIGFISYSFAYMNLNFTDGAINAEKYGLGKIVKLTVSEVV